MLGIGDTMDYRSKRWEHTRARVLRRDLYTCQYFKRYGLMREANTVHHVIPVKDRPDLEWDTRLMVSLSFEAHNKMHDRNTDELTKEGERLAIRIVKKLPKAERDRLGLNIPE